MNNHAGPGGGGPLVGSGMKRWIADEAITADMEHRGFSTLDGGGTYQLLGTDGNDSDPNVWKVLVRDGSVDIEMIVGNENDDAVPDASEYSHYQSEVFDYWPGAIDEVFVGWEDMAESSGLSYDASSVLHGAGEIQVNAETAGGSSTGVNVRLNTDIEDLTTRTGQLNGHYAETFNEKYVAGLSPVLDNLNSMTQVLAFALAAEEGVFQKTREQIAEVALQAKSAMIASAPKSGGGLTGVKLALIVVGAAAAGVATFATGGSALAVAGALTSAGAGATGGLLGALAKEPEEGEPLPLEADTPQGVLTNLSNALTDINTAIKAEENQIQQLLEAGDSEASAEDGNIFDIKRPGIINHTGDSVLDPAQLVTVDPESIAKITELWIPTINGDLKACANGLTGTAGSWTRPDNIGIDPQGPWPAYRTLQSAMEGHLLNMVSELSGAADSLQQAASLIGLSDEQTNERFSRQAGRINDQDIDTIS